MWQRRSIHLLAARREGGRERERERERETVWCSNITFQGTLPVT
jgi:hypothetical protein